VDEAMDLLTDRLRAWRQGGPRPTDADEEFVNAMDRLGE
jgi:hypothetical protein